MRVGKPEHMAPEQNSNILVVQTRSTNFYPQKHNMATSNWILSHQEVSVLREANINDYLARLQGSWHILSRQKMIENFQPRENMIMKKILNSIKLHWYLVITYFKNRFAELLVESLKSHIWSSSFYTKLPALRHLYYKNIMSKKKYILYFDSMKIFHIENVSRIAILDK